MNKIPVNWLIILVLTLASLAGNYFHLSLFLGIDLLFGGIFVLITIYFYGQSWGTIVALIAASYTYFLWGHPYAALILVGEAVFVSHH